MRFTQFYNCAKCAETRATLLTGNYNQAVGTSDMTHGATVAEVLRPIGYRTLIAGKWHQAPLPTTRGFERYYGLADGCCNFWNPGIEAREGEGKPGRKRKTARRWAIEDQEIRGYTNPDKSFYTTDAFTDYAIERIRETPKDQPFLQYLPYTAPHYPLHAWPKDIAKYRGKFKMGWDKLRKTRHARMLKMGIIDAVTHPLPPRVSNAKAWDELTSEQQDAEDLKMAVYCAMIDRVDQNLGRLFDVIRERGDWENTLVIFISDNGACAEQPNTTPNIPPGPVESYRTISVGWANASNTPYRKFKSSDYEGGTRTPMIAHWPGVIKPGTFCRDVGHIIDIVPTYMDITGAKYPAKNSVGNPTKPPAGTSLLPLFQGESRKGHKRIFWQFGKARAVREGNLKAVKFGKEDWELYDLSTDQTEMKNLAGNQPEKTRELAEAWNDWLEGCKR